MKRIAFVTCSIKPDFSLDDLIAVDALIAGGAQVRAIPWDSDFADWHTFDKVVLRSCWNYHLHPAKFLHWLEDLERNNVKLFNSINAVRANIHKSYLEVLSRKGVVIPKTTWLSKGASVTLSDFLKKQGWAKAVVKPAISATAYKTLLVSSTDSQKHQDVFNDMLNDNDLLVQQFIPEVMHGEVSLIFFNKKFSHAVLKKPKSEDFRVQNDFGGTVESYQPTEKLIREGEKILSYVEEPLLYARVDGILVNNQFLLMELELIEPVLFFKQSNVAAGHFSDIILH